MSSQTNVTVSAPLPGKEVKGSAQQSDVFEMRSAAHTAVNMLDIASYEISQIGGLLHEAQQALQTGVGPNLMKEQLSALLIVAQSRHAACEAQVHEAMTQAEALHLSLDIAVDEEIKQAESGSGNSEGDPHH